MDFSIVGQLLKLIITGGPAAIISLLMLIVAYLLWEKRSVQKNNKETLEKMANIFAEKVKEERQDLISIIDRYQEGQINLLQAINEIKVLIATISGKL